MILKITMKIFEKRDIGLKIHEDYLKKHPINLFTIF